MRRWPHTFVLALSAGLAVVSFAPLRGQQAPASSAAVTTGVREAAWSPDGSRLAVSWFDAIWTMTPDGKDMKRVVSAPQGWASERDPVWSPDGREIAFSASTNGEFDVWVAPAAGGEPRRVNPRPGDERWPSWSKDGRSLLVSHRPPKGTWTLLLVPSQGPGEAVSIGAGWQGAISPDGKRVAFVSDRAPEPNNETDIWLQDLTSTPNGWPPATRVTKLAGDEINPSWAPDNNRVAYGRANGIYVSPVAAPATPTPANAPAEVLASRRFGVPAWSPDSQWLAIATFTIANAGYNGNPSRNDNDPPAALGAANQYQLWRVLAPRVVDEGATSVAPGATDAARWTSAFDQVWQTLKSLYYASGPSAAEWDKLRDQIRPRMAAVTDRAAAEAIIDELIAKQPPIKPGPAPAKGMVASGHPLASAAGAAVLERGGNVIDAGIATAFALGVVEPDASGLGGDGQAILFLKGMTEPVVVEYKDMTPSRIAADNTRLFNANGGRTAPDGPTVVNIPGVVAGLDHLYKKFGSKKVAWADLVAPAIKLADEGYILDEALPTTIAEGRAAFTKYPEAAKIFLPGGRIPKPGDRFVNKDLADTLRVLAKEGGDSFYRGSIAKRIAEDMEANGGVIAQDDLAQYKAVERKPLAGMFHGHKVYSVPAPVSTGLQIVETLNILDGYKPRAGATYANDADYLHYAIEAWRVRDGGARISDPDKYPVDLGNHLEAAHALERFKLIDPAKVYSAAGGRGGGAPIEDPLPLDAPDPSRRVQSGTTSFVVADGEGNMIAFTQTLSTWGGAYYVSKGLGFLYNDHFRGGAGRGGGFGSTLPWMRSSTTSVPTLVFAPARNGFVPRMAVGAAGNAWIPASVYNIILNVVDGGLPAQAAIEAPRLLIGGGGGGRSNIQIEDRIPRGILADLEARGHTFTKVGRKGEVKYGYAAVAVVDASKKTVQAGAEPRRSHGVAATSK